MREGDAIKIKIRSKIKRGTQKLECARFPAGGVLLLDAGGAAA